MMEQEDTMEKQDTVISHKDEQIKSLTSGTASYEQGSDFENNETWYNPVWLTGLKAPTN